MNQNCHSAEEDWILSIPYLLASVGTNKVWQSLLLGIPVFVAGHINLGVTQAKKVDKKPISSCIKVYDYDETGN